MGKKVEVNDCFSESKFSKIKMLKIIIRSLVNTHCDINPTFAMIPEDIRIEIINSLIVAYIELWLEYDESNKQTIYSYVEDISQMQSQLSAGRLNESPTLLKEMYNGEKLIRYNVLLQNKYSEENNFKYKKMSSKLDYGNKYTLLELESFYKAGVEPLGIYRDIFKNDEPYYTKHRGKDFSEYKRNLAKIDLDEYREYLEHVNSLINDNVSTNEKPTKNDKEFVVKCLYVWKMERTYRYRLTAILSKYLRDNRDSIKEIYIPDTIKNFIDIYPEKLSNEEIICHNSYFIKKYEEIINSAYSVSDSTHCEAVGIARACFDICFRILCNNFRTKTLLGSWTENDFEDVARFMIDEYGIGECLQIPDMGEEIKGRKSSYLYIRKLFGISDYIDADQITYYKEEIDKI